MLWNSRNWTLKLLCIISAQLWFLCAAFNSLLKRQHNKTKEASYKCHLVILILIKLTKICTSESNHFEKNDTLSEAQFTFRIAFDELFAGVESFNQLSLFNQRRGLMWRKYSFFFTPPLSYTLCTLNYQQQRCFIIWNLRPHLKSNNVEWPLN